MTGSGSRSKKVFQVGDVEVKVRSAPGLGGATLKYLPVGQTLEADPASRTEKDGYVWWQHDDGWSAERSVDGSEVFLLESAASAPPTKAKKPDLKTKKLAGKKRFEIGSVPVRVRSAPNLQGTTVKYLDAGTSLEVDAASRTEADNYVWWQHDDGWSAERSVDGSEVFFLESAPSAPPVKAKEPPVKAKEPAAKAKEPATKAKKPAGKKRFQIGSVPVRVRDAPGLQGASLKYLDAGTLLEVDATSRTEADNYVWWQHDDGWSAERSVDGKEIYLFEPGQAVSAPAVPSAAPVSVPLPEGEELPLQGQVFKRLPVDLDQTHWWQYFGNNRFAHQIWQEGKRWYQFSQGLHAGLDFGNSTTRGVKVYAGVEGTFYKHGTDYYAPNSMWVQVGDYLIIYGHLVNPGAFPVGQAVGPDTVMGEIQYGGQQHLHLEVRYGDEIVNPLLLMPEDMRNSLFQKFPPSAEYFYTDSSWTKWQTPLDQPRLKVSGPLVGPHARRR
jgi:murein DD-endopeptidase MepM/ murein hydrolase activator NlpD